MYVIVLNQLIYVYKYTLSRLPRIKATRVAPLLGYEIIHGFRHQATILIGRQVPPIAIRTGLMSNRHKTLTRDGTRARIPSLAGSHL
jgi:hypothetical protein